MADAIGTYDDRYVVAGKDPALGAVTREVRTPNFQRRGLRLLLCILANARRRKIGVDGVCSAHGRLMGKPQKTNDRRSRHGELG